MGMPEPGAFYEDLEPAERNLLSELDLLEEKIQEITRTVETLREEKRALERECEHLRGERTVTVERLTHLIQKVDALRGDS